MIRVAAVVVAALAAATGCGDKREQVPETARAPETIELRSSAFADDAPLPVEYTCSGRGVTPPLEWSGVPAGTQQLILVVEDPDAPDPPFVHWFVSHIDPAATGVAVGAVPGSGREEKNGFGKNGYAPPCPPPKDGPHRYVFTIYASNSNSFDAGQALRGGRVRARGTLTGTFDR